MVWKRLLMLFYTFLLILSTAYALKITTSGISSHNHTIKCIPTDRQALLKLKSSLQSTADLLKSWGREGHDNDCCKWSGVECSNTTGHVTRLDLSWSYNTCEIDASLVELRYLTHLNLSGNYHNYCQIPEFIGHLSKLEELDLSNSAFGGSIPHQLGNLSRLKLLDLSQNFFNRTSIPESFKLLRSLIHLSIFDSFIGGKLQDQLRNLSKLHYLDLSENDISVERLEWVSQLHSLQHLLMDGLDLSKAFDWGQTLMNLPRITQLQLSYTYPPVLDSVPPTMTLKNTSSSLSFVGMSNNDLTSSIFGWLINLNSSLLEIDLHDNFLRGPIPNEIGNMPFLSYLDVSNNRLNGNLSNRIAHLYKLSYLDLSSNSFHGIISEDHLSNFTNMKHLFLSSNYLTLSLGHYWIPPFQLYSIGLSSCSIGPQFPRWLQTQASLYFIDLSSNLISGIVPDWFWNLSSKASFFNISNNKIHDKVPRETFSRNYFMDIALIVDLSYNYFEGPLPLFNLNAFYVDLSKNNFVGSLSSLCNSSNIIVLDLSDNNLSGELPQCWKERNYIQLFQLSLSNNNLTGNIHNSLCPVAGSYLTSLQLSDNSFTGELPTSLSNCTRLRVLDVASNMISGSIPEWIGSNLRSLRILILRSNRFSGSISPNLCLLQQVQIMDLSHNNLRGCLVNCLHNSTALTGKRPPGYSYLFGVYINNVEFYPTNVTTTKGLDLPHTYFIQFDETLPWKGREYQYSKNLEHMTMVDFSSNKLQGEIPEEFGNLVGLVQLNLSYNYFTGHVPHRIGEMQKLEVLDLSSNHLSGEIPQSISNLNFLDYLNLSNNNLAGRIPTGTQIQTQNATSFMGNPQLCGDPLPKKCHQEEAKAPPPINNIGSYKDKDGFFISMAVGFVIGFWGVLGSLLFCDFRFMNRAAYWV